MRVASALALTILATAPALAADYPVLRGGYTPTPSYREPNDDQTQWEGFYLGGYAHYTSANFRSAGWPRQLAPGFAYITNPPSSPAGALLGSERGASFGGFLGYNMVFGDAVLGVEADFSRISMSKFGAQTYIPGSSQNPGPGLSSFYDVVQSATIAGKTTLDAYGTIRARAGWAYGAFMPYLTGGLAIGKGSYTTSLTAMHASSPTVPIHAGGESKKDLYLVGGTVGAGLDMLVASHILLRAEYQYTTFSGARIPLNLHMVRAGAGVKF